MVVLKSAPLNARFLQSTPTGSTHASPTRLSTGPQGAASPAAPASASAQAPLQSSKLKFTTSRGSALRTTREASPVPSSADGFNGSGTGGVAGDKKAPVWNKGMPAKKSAKDYTDEELKAMHGISLVSRTVTDTNHNRWDDSDEDDNWDDTIDFGDGTKVVVSKIQPAKEAPKSALRVEPRKVAAPVQQPIAAVEAPVVREMTPVTRASPAPSTALPAKAPGNPWKKPESAPSQPLNIAQLEFPAVGEKAPVPSAGHVAHNRDRSDSFDRDGRQAHGERPQYQYEQNNYDRHWQQPQPSTREIFNYTTGQFEEIDATKGRRPSQHEGRARPGLLQKIAASVNKDANARRVSKEGQAATPATEAIKSPVATPTDVAAPVKPEPPAQPAAPVLDPSSTEFIEMQKKLMADARAQAILRRKEQDEEEFARKERARKKAEELAAQAEKEAAAAKAAKEAKAAELKAAKAKQEAAKAPPKQILKGTVPEERTASSAKLEETWQRGVKLPQRKSSQDVRPKKPSISGPVASFQRAPEDAPIDGDQGVHAQQRNVWGPIGPKQANGEKPVLASSDALQDRAPTASPAAQSLQSEPTPTTWNAFDGIATRRPQVSLPGSSSKEHEPADSWKQSNAFKKNTAQQPALQGKEREYVFDAADEVLTLERNNKQSPQGAAQATRTSSRFFPSAAGNGNAVKRPGTAASQESGSGNKRFISPILPPNFADADLLSNADIPALKLPSAAQTGKSRTSATTTVPLRANLHKVLHAIRAQMKPQTAALSERDIYGKLGQGWLETQTRTIWEVLPPRHGHALARPRVTVARRSPSVNLSSAPSVKAANLPPKAPWALPTTLEVTSRTNGITEPLVPPKPSLSLPTHSRGVTPLKRRQQNQREQGKAFVVTRQDLVEAPDFSSPIRIKTTGQAQEPVQVPRKYGKRLESGKQETKRADVQRQPRNMNDHGKGHGFHRGFADRVRTPAQSAPVEGGK
ncbi:hypothetical protein BCR37DRAFT_387641 [Protomyces lactucae-debilis]|uniref:Uncharacterized protein n=1 Tax=Protomyces lactucae-debilis TaxID=2754530 RepID=A0A1Y2FD44_PROLT|nr:uncharacterized protein BCR37DRAFT_387641 [Protomyces lactucae-debilis]ORY81344.1 hypothetical protein BCR37DRAFT_387641 [Protomyces lactucae-debilis]